MARSTAPFLPLTRRRSECSQNELSFHSTMWSFEVGASSAVDAITYATTQHLSNDSQPTRGAHTSTPCLPPRDYRGNPLRNAQGLHPPAPRAGQHNSPCVVTTEHPEHADYHDLVLSRGRPSHSHLWHVQLLSVEGPPRRTVTLGLIGLHAVNVRCIRQRAEPSKPASEPSAARPTCGQEAQRADATHRGGHTGAPVADPDACSPRSGSRCRATDLGHGVRRPHEIALPLGRWLLCLLFVWTDKSPQRQKPAHGRPDGGRKRSDVLQRVRLEDGHTEQQQQHKEHGRLE